jgi:Zn-dependent protease
VRSYLGSRPAEAYAHPVAMSPRSLQLKAAGRWIFVAVAALAGLIALAVMVMIDVLQAAGVD